MKEHFIWDKYLKLLNSKQEPLLCKVLADKYVNSFAHKKLYKYFNFASSKTERNKRLKQLKDEKLWLSKRDSLNDPFDMMMAKIFFNSSEEQCEEYMDSVNKTREILCLTTNPKNKLMWSHYGDSHKGYCVEFGHKNLFIKPIQYISKRPYFTELYKDFYNNKEKILSQNSDDINAETIKVFNTTPMFYFKDKCWAYENEFRIVTPPKKVSSSGSLYFTNELGLTITKVICGLNCEEEDIERLRNIVEEINKRRYLERKKFFKLSYNKEEIQKILKNNPKLTYNKMIEMATQHNLFIPYVKITKIIVNDDFKLKEVNIILKDKMND